MFLTNNEFRNIIKQTKFSVLIQFKQKIKMSVQRKIFQKMSLDLLTVADSYLYINSFKRKNGAPGG